MGETIRMVGRATRKAKAHAFSQMRSMFFTSPTLNRLMTNDIIQDMSSDMKNEKTYFWYFGSIIKSINKKRLSKREGGSLFLKT